MQAVGRRRGRAARGGSTALTAVSDSTLEHRHRYAHRTRHWVIGCRASGHQAGAYFILGAALRLLVDAGYVRTAPGSPPRAPTVRVFAIGAAEAYTTEPNGSVTTRCYGRRAGNVAALAPLLGPGALRTPPPFAWEQSALYARATATGASGRWATTRLAVYERWPGPGWWPPWTCSRCGRWNPV